MKMRIAIEARVLTGPGSGITTYVRELTRALLAAESSHEYDILDHGPRQSALIPLWLNTTVPRWLNAIRPDIVHFTKVAVPQRKQYPTVATIHDVIPLLFPDSQRLLPRISWPATLHHTARSADHILTISEASKRDIVEYLQVAPEKVTTTPLAINHSMYHEVSNRTHYVGAAAYIFFVGTIEPRKNVAALVRAFARIADDVPHHLVIAGRPYKGIEEVKQAIGESGVSERIELWNFVPEGELNALYAQADLFVWPSIYEGWGFPAQEAMAAGTPVIVSNGGSLPEVVGSAGEIVPFTVDTIAARTDDEAFEVALAERMRAVLTDPAKQARMRKAGILHAQKNSWADVAQSTLNVYERVAREQ